MTVEMVNGCPITLAASDLETREDLTTPTVIVVEVFSPAIRTQLKGAVGVAGQAFSESSATPGAGARRRLPPGGTRHFADAGA